MPGIDEYYSNLGKQQAYIASRPSSYATCRHEQNMQTYMLLSAMCSGPTNFSNASRSMSRSDNIEIPSEWTNRGIF